MLYVCAGWRVSCSGLNVVIRAPNRPPCTETLEWFESGPDIPEEIAAQTPSSSQSATNSRIVALPLKIVIWTGEGRRTGCVDGEWMIEEWKPSRKGGLYSISYPVTMLSQRRRGKGVPQGRESGSPRERARTNEGGHKNVHRRVWPCICVCMWKEHGKRPLRLLLLKQCVS